MPFLSPNQQCPSSEGRMFNCEHLLSCKWRQTGLTHPERQWLKLGPVCEQIHVDRGTVAVAGLTVAGLRLEKCIDARAVHKVRPQLQRHHQSSNHQSSSSSSSSSMLTLHDITHSLLQHLASIIHKQMNNDCAEKHLKLWQH